MMAVAASLPELKLEEGEDKALATAVQAVIDHYEITALNSIAGVVAHPLTKLARTVWSIYYIKIIAIQLRLAADRATEINPKPASAQNGAQPPRPDTRPPPPRPQAPPSPPGTQQAPTVMRANPIPGFEGVIIDVAVGKPQ